jgi:hypothetical protein
MTKILRSIYFDKKQVERLIALSGKTRIPQAVLMREGIDLVLKKHGEHKKRRASSGKNEVHEKRKFVRVLTNLKAQYSVKGKKSRWKRCTVINIHHKGFGLEFHSVTKINEGEILLFSVALTDKSDPIEIRGSVQWMKERKRYFVGGIKVVSVQDEDKLAELVRRTLGIKEEEG